MIKQQNWRLARALRISNAPARLAKAFNQVSPFCSNCWSVCLHSFWQSDLCITALQQLQVRISTSGSSMSLSSHDFATCVAFLTPIMPQWLWSACQSSSYRSCTAQFKKRCLLTPTTYNWNFAHLHTIKAPTCSCTLRMHTDAHAYTEACMYLYAQMLVRAYAYMICTHTCAYMRVYARICTKTCTHMQTCMRAYEHVHARIRYSHILYARACTHKHTARASIHTRAHTIFTYVYILIHAYMHTYYTYMHAYIHTNIQQQHTHTHNQLSFIHVYIHACIHAYIQPCIYTHINTYIHAYSTRTCMHTHSFIHTYMYTYMHTCIHKPMHAYIHSYILHTYIHTNLFTTRTYIYGCI